MEILLETGDIAMQILLLVLYQQVNTDDSRLVKVQAVVLRPGSDVS